MSTDDELHALIRMGEGVLVDLDRAIFADMIAAEQGAGTEVPGFLPSAADLAPEEFAGFRERWEKLMNGGPEHPDEH